MIDLVLRILAAPIVGEVMKVFQRAQELKLSKAALEAEVKRAVVNAITSQKRELAKLQTEVVKEEITSDGWLQRNWRPIVALSAFFSYWFVIVAYPFLAAGDLLPQVRFGEAGLENLFWLTAISVGGYIGGRSIEKAIRYWRE